jgi:ribosomal protein S27AE
MVIVSPIFVMESTQNYVAHPKKNHGVKISGHFSRIGALKQQNKALRMLNLFYASFNNYYTMQKIDIVASFCATTIQIFTCIKCGAFLFHYHLPKMIQRIACGKCLYLGGTHFSIHLCFINKHCLASVSHCSFE